MFSFLDELLESGFFSILFVVLVLCRLKVSKSEHLHHVFFCSFFRRLLLFLVTWLLGLRILVVISIRFMPLTFGIISTSSPLLLLDSYHLLSCEILRNDKPFLTAFWAVRWILPSTFRMFLLFFTSISILLLVLVISLFVPVPISVTLVIRLISVLISFMVVSFPFSMVVSMRFSLSRIIFFDWSRSRPPSLFVIHFKFKMVIIFSLNNWN